MKASRALLAVAAATLLAGTAAVAWLNLRGDDDGGEIAAAQPAAASSVPGVTTPLYRDDGQPARGAYLARAGNCAGCHSAPGGTPYAGGRPIETPFGTVYSPNLTPDAATGLGAWSAAEFRRALRHGRSRDGRLLTPVFPYDNYTRVSTADADALYAYLRSLPATRQANRPHALRFPYGSQAALAVWRALYFRPGRFEADAIRPAAWNRGAYLVQGLGHCSACHAARNALGGNAGPLDLSGGLIARQNWYAPSLSDSHEAGVADWRDDEVVALLKTGISPRAVVAGPMAEVVLGSTQHLSDADLGAMATYLKALPAGRGAATVAANVSRDAGQSSVPDAQADPGLSLSASASGSGSSGSGAGARVSVDAGAGAAPRPSASASPGDADTANTTSGPAIYRQHCAGCHGADGRGVPGAYPALAGNRAVALDPPANLVRIVVEGGFAPATAGNPRPYGMPPFATVLSSEQIAAVLTTIRSAWGSQAPAVSAQQVGRYRD